MLAQRSETILRIIIEHYINNATPASSQQIARESGLGISSATVRNEVALLEQEGYVTHPHTSAGSIPSDRGYRRYVDSLKNLDLPLAKRLFLNHLFHQVETELDQWLSLAASLLAQTAQNIAVVTVPKPTDCKLKHVEIVSLQDFLALVILVLQGAKVKQKLIEFDGVTTQSSLTTVGNRLNEHFGNLTGKQIRSKELVVSPVEEAVLGCILDMMQAEDEHEYEIFLDGMHFILGQPEFTQSNQLKSLMALAEQRRLRGLIPQSGLSEKNVQVIIGKENQNEVMQKCSVVVSRFGLPDEAVGTIGVVGPTRMAYGNVISSVYYLSAVLSGLIAGLYGRERGPASN